MKRTFISLLAVGFCIGFSGCKSTPKVDVEKTILDIMQDEAALVTSNGGMAAIGVAKSKSIQTARAKARIEARKNLAQVASQKIEQLETAFVAEVGVDHQPELHELFCSVEQEMTPQRMDGTKAKRQKYEVDDEEGITTAYVLMVWDPNLIHEALKGNEALYKQFKTSKVCTELEAEIKKFDEAQKAAL